MFKLVVFATLLALAVARPGAILAPTIYSSAVVGHVPTSISHHSSSIVHSHAIAAPIVHAAPLVHTYHAAPLINAYATHGALIL